jgi:hypothetical protein
MSKTEEFWEFAREATLLACNAEADEDKRGLFYLARPWTQAPLAIAAATVNSAPHEAVSVGCVVFDLRRQVEHGYAIVSSWRRIDHVSNPFGYVMLGYSV